MLAASATGANLANKLSEFELVQMVVHPEGLAISEPAESQRAIYF